MAKKPWYSKTLITNLVLALSALFLPGVSEWVAGNGTTVALIWTGINAGLRLITKDKISFYG